MRKIFRKREKEEEGRRKKERGQNIEKENLEMPQDKLTTFYYTHLEEVLDSQLRTLDSIPRKKMAKERERKREITRTGRGMKEPREMEIIIMR